MIDEHDVEKILGDIFGHDNSFHAKELHFSSFELMSLLIEFEKKYDLNFYSIELDYDNFTSLSAITKFINSKLNL